MEKIKKSKLGKILAVLLFCSVIFSGLPVTRVYAESSTVDASESELQGEQSTEESDTIEASQNNDNVQEDQNNEMNQDDQDKEDEEKLQENPDSENVESNIEQSSETETDEASLNYLYLSNDYIELDGTQEIMISLGNGEENIENMHLILSKENGEEISVESKEKVGNTWLFQKAFTESEEGIFTLLRLEFTENGKSSEYIFTDHGMSVKFGVNKQVDSDDISQHINMETYVSPEDEVEASIVTLSENADEAVDSIASALNEAEQDSTKVPYARMKSRAATSSAKSTDNLVIVLDPGHDASHTGAYGNGVHEEVATLKIAQFCREELEQYGNVTVYMTREEAACPYPETVGKSSGNILDIKKRVTWASSKGADAYISFHLNSSESSKPNGAQVFYPESSQGTDISNKGKNLADKIQQELLNLGLSKRSNSAWDYTVNTESAKYGFPGLIIEHAFVSNKNDASDYLNSDEKLKKLGIADATGIAKYFGLSKEKYVNIEQGTYTISTAVDTDKVIKAKSSDIVNGIGINIDESTDTSLQHFEIIPVGDGYYKIESEISGLVLDVDNGSSETGTSVRLYQWNNTAAQKWRFYNAGDGYYYIQSAVGTYLNLKDGNASSGNSIWMWTNDKTVSCKWKLSVTENRPVQDGTYIISTSVDNNKALDIDNASISDGANVQIYGKNNSSAQRFEVTYVGNSYYRIASEKSGRVLDVQNGSKEPGTNVQQFTWNKSASQLWKFIKLEDGRFYIKSMLGTVLDVLNSGTVDGTNVQTASMNGCNAQKWSLTTSNYKNIEDGRYVIRAQDSNFSVLSENSSNIQIDSFDNVKTQKFDINYVNNGYYKILDVGTNKVLTVNNSSSEPGANLCEKTWNESDSQLWKFIENDSGGYYLKSKLGTYVDVYNVDFTDGNNIQMYTLNGGSSQKWLLDSKWAEMNETPVEEGVYYIHSSLNENKVLDIANGSLESGVKVQLYTKNKTISQKFAIVPVKDGYYKIVSEVSGKVLDIANGSTDSGVTIWQMPWNGTDAQLWRFIDAGDGYFYIKSKLGTVIDLSNGNTSDRTSIDAYNINGTGAQKWKLEIAESGIIENGTYVIQSSLNPFYVLSTISSGVGIKTFDNINTQKYTFTYQTSGYYKIENTATNKCLTVKNKNSGNKAEIVEENWDNQENQLWKVMNAGNNQFYIKSKYGTYMDIANGILSEGNQIWMYEGNGTSAQKWSLSSKWASMEKQPLKDGVYRIVSSLNSNKVLDVANGSLNDQANIQLYTNNGTSSQRFELVYVDNGYYKIISEYSGKVLDVANGSNSSGANIQQFTWNETDSQLWKLFDLGDGKYVIKSKLGTVVDLANGNTADKSNIDAFMYNGTGSQKWDLDECGGLVEDGTYVIANASQNLKVLTSKNGNIQLNGFDNVKAQKYDIREVENGYYKITDSDTGKVLEVANGSSLEKANLQEADWNESDGQLWKFIKPSEGNTFIIKSKLGTVIDVDNGELKDNRNVQLYTLNGSVAQEWTLKSDWATFNEGQIIENGTYYLNSALGNNQVLDVRNASMSDGGNIQICEKNGNSAQRFEIKYMGEGYYRITAEHSDKALDVSNGSTVSGTNVQQMGWNSTSSQLWKFIPDGQGNYYVKSKLGTVLDVCDGRAVSGTNVWAYELNGSLAQKWKLTESDYEPITDGQYLMFTKSKFNLVIDVDSNTNQVQLADTKKTDSQYFQIKYQGKGYYQIKSKSLGMVLEVKNASDQDGASVQVANWTGSDGQLWKFIDCSDGTYQIKSKLGTVLAISKDNIESGAVLHMNTFNNSSVQKWGIYDPSKLNEIMGTGFTNVQQMARYYKSRNKSYPYSGTDVPTIEDFCQIYLEECEMEGVKAEVAFCQAMLETGFLTFKGDVKPDQYNFAGLGATGGGVQGAKFTSIRIGIRAQIQHLKAYATDESVKLNNVCVDERFGYVKRGCAPYVEWLGQKENPMGTGWATSQYYGYNILKCINELRSY